MDTQNTPVHIKLWHREFWMMAIANMLLMTAIYICVPSLMAYLKEAGFTALETAACIGIYGLGIFVLGARCSYLVQRYRRNQVCLYAIAAVVATTLCLYYAIQAHYASLLVVLALRFLLGVSLGLAQMTLSSTLIIDTCESFQRTGANHAAAWFARFALSLGPALSLFVGQQWGDNFALLVSSALAVVAFILIAAVRFPFKTPADHVAQFSLDRFFLPQALPLFLLIMTITTIVGLLFAMPHAETYYGMIMPGFVLALLSEKYVFANADLKSEVITGLFALAAAILLLLAPQPEAATYLSPALLGFGVGIMGSRLLLFLIKLARHCQRGTSQSTFFLAWELGISLGLFLGLGVIPPAQIPIVGLILAALALITYNISIHPWYMKHKNR